MAIVLPAFTTSAVITSATLISQTDEQLNIFMDDATVYLEDTFVDVSIALSNEFSGYRTEAITSASTATTKASEAAASATAASASATAAASSATNASTSASTATTKASESATSAASAAASTVSASSYSTNASSSASTATTKASESATSAASAAASAASALASKNAAATSETNALASKNAAATSATNASSTLSAMQTLFDNFDDRFLGTKASDPTLDNDGNDLLVGAVYYNSVSKDLRFYNGVSWDVPSTSATNAATSASNSATAAATSATNAASSATASASSATDALASKNAAATSAANAAGIYDMFDDTYLGAKASDPTLDNDGGALQAGALYFNSTNNSVKVYTGTVWLALSSIDAYTKTETQTALPKVGFDTSNVVVPSVGQVAWNQDESTLDLGLNGAILQIGQEQLIKVRNNTGSTINNGKAVMAIGTIGNSGRITIAPANLTQANAKYILGIVTENIAAGADGFCTVFGKVRGIQTNGTNYGETWVDGDVLYVKDSGSGALTKTVPNDTQVKLPVAIVISSHASNGTLFVRVNSIDENALVNTIDSKLALKAPLNSPVFTGTVTAPTFSGALNGNATSATTATNVAWSGVTSKPTTLQGYGIVPEEMPSNIDLDTKTTTALFSQGSNSEATTALKYPVSSAGLLEVFAYSSMIHQRYWVYNSDDIYYRAKYSTGAWSAWVKGANVNDSITGNAATATTLQTARTINGVSFNGSTNIVVPQDTTIIEW